MQLSLAGGMALASMAMETRPLVEGGIRRSHVRPPSFDIATLQKCLRLVVIERDAEGKLLLACSAKFAVLAAKFERAKQGHIVFHVRKFGCSEDGAMATPIAMNAQYLGGQEYGVQAVMRHDGSLR